MTLYLVHGNTYYDGYGYVEHVFGVYTEKDAAEAAKDIIAKELYEKEIKNEYTYVKDISDIEVEAVEIKANEIIDINLGGYCE